MTTDRPDYTRPQSLPNLAEFDWDTDDETEREEFFLTCRQEDHRRSVDRRGHDDTLPKFGMPQGTYGQISQLVEDKRTPYRSVHDFLRDAVIHRLQDMVEWMDNDGFSEHAQVIVSIAETESFNTSILAKEELLNNQVTAINNAVRTQNWNKVREGVDKAKEMLIFMDIDTRELAYCVETAERELERHFGN